MKFEATFSNCGKYRYDLWRTWDKDKPYLMVIGLNPSTANELEDDPTIRRCKRFAADWGFGSLCMVNLFAYRATRPKDMFSYNEPIGINNDTYLLKHAEDAGLVLAAWGINGSHLSRDSKVQDLLEEAGTLMKCLGTTKDGYPRHPLYVKADTKPILF